MFKRFLAPIAFLALPYTAMAATVDISVDSAWNQYKSISGIRSDTVTRGADLVGMIVTATYLDGTTEEVVWGRTRGGGHSDGFGFNLFLGWSEFQLTVTKTLTSLTLDGVTGNSIFDTSRSRLAGEDTYGSKVGFPFYVVGDYDPDGTIEVNYSHSFYVAGQQRATDAYTLMKIDFTGLEGGGLSQDLQFRTDLDSLEEVNDLTAVPLPASLLMFASAFGLLGTGVVRQRASKKTMT